LTELSVDESIEVDFFNNLSEVFKKNSFYTYFYFTSLKLKMYFCVEF